jgi:hypothetical protein
MFSSAITRPTQPVPIAELGIDRNWQVFGSCAITNPPTFRAAWTPSVASLPTPVSTLAIKRLPNILPPIQIVD